MMSVCFNLSEKSRVDLYNAPALKYLGKEISKEGCFEIQAKSARLIMVLPPDRELKMREGNYAAGTTVVALDQE